jgi:hypothetical protein
VLGSNVCVDDKRKLIDEFSLLIDTSLSSINSDSHQSDGKSEQNPDPSQTFHSAQSGHSAQSCVTDAERVHTIHEHAQVLANAEAHDFSAGPVHVQEPTIPLPHKHSPSKPMLTSLIFKLRDCGIITPQQADEISTLQAVNKLQATHDLFSLWLEADRVGKRGPSNRSTFKPTQPGLTASTFRVDNFETLMMDEQTDVCNFLFDGFENGFRLHRTKEWTTVEFDNGQMPSEEVRKQLQDSIENDLTAGFIMARPDDGVKWQCSPIFMVPKTVLGEPTGAFRRITHFSKENPQSPSVNATIPDELAAISYVSTRDLQTLILDLHDEGHSEIVLGKIDLKNAYRLMPIHEDDWPSLGFSDTEGRQFYETRLPFGLKQGCRLFSALSNTISWALSAYGVANVDYIDDFAFANANPVEGNLAIDTANKIFELLGIPTSPHKEERCRPAMVFLGIEHDARNLVIRMPEARLHQMQKLLQSWLERESATVQELMVLTGCLCSALQVIPQGRMFLRRCYAALSFGRGAAIKGRPTRHWIQQWKQKRISMSIDLQKDIRWWSTLLSHFNGSVRMQRTPSRQPDHLVWTDASNYAMSGVFNNQYWQRLYERELLFMKNPRITIAAKEMMAVTISCAIWGAKWKDNHVRFHCDNKGDVDSFRKQANKNPLTQHLMRVIALQAARFGFSFELIWISTVDNVQADVVSRLPLCDIPSVTACSNLTHIIQSEDWTPPSQDDPQWEEEFLGGILLGH